ncbi:MAG: AAA family ATPase [Chloroflexota bacterium]
MINGRYQLHNKLGQGGMGIVHRATDRLTGEIVALKQVFLPVEQIMFTSHPISQTNQELRLALAHEFQTLAGLRHPHIISVLDYGFDEEKQPFFTMSYLEGAQTIVAAANGRSVPEKVTLLIQMLEALAYLHRRGILHRDLKPDNVLVVGNTVRVLDFGLAAAKEQATESVGSWLYMAPEVLLGQPASEASDLYTVGVLAYRLLAGTHPFDIYAEDTIGEILEGEPDWGRMEVGEGLAAVVRTLLAKKPADRYANVNQVIAALYSALGQQVPGETAVIRESYLQAASFVGREAEMAQLTDTLAQAKAGQGSAWLIGGESGVGKTRLINELRTHALVSGFQVWRGQAIAEGGSPFHSWRDIVEHLALHTKLNQLEAGVLKEIAPNLPQILQRSIPDAPVLEGSAGKERFIFTMVSLLQRQTQPILLLLEDLHWVNESLQLVEELVDGLANRPILLIGAFRSDERPFLPQELGNGFQTLLLSRFDDGHVGQLAQAMLGEVGQQPEVVAQLQVETEGNIFFLVEILRAWAEEAGGLLQVGQTALPEQLLTGGIQQIVRRRLDKVPAAYQPLLQLAALAGRKLDLAVMAHLASPLSLEAWLLACGETAVLEVHENSWQFVMDKLREGLLQDFAPEARRAGHKQVALALEAVYPNRDDLAIIISSHWREAQNIEKELAYAITVGNQLAWAGNYNEAEQMLTRLLSQNTVQLEPETRLSLLHILGGVYRDADKAKESVAIFREGLALARQSGTEAITLKFLTDLGRALWRQVQYEQKHGSQPHHQAQLNEAETYILEAVQLAEKLGDLAGLAHSIHNQAPIAMLRGEGAEKLLHFTQQSYALFQQSQDVAGLLISINDLAVSLKIAGAIAQAKQRLQEGLALSRQVGNAQSTPFLLSNLLSLAFIEGNWAEVALYLPEFLQFASQPQHLFYSDGVAYQMMHQFQQEAYELASSIYQKSLPHLPSAGEWSGAFNLVHGATLLMLGQGDDLTASILKNTSTHPTDYDPNVQQFLWLLFAGKSLLDGHIQQGAAWLGFHQTLEKLVDSNDYLYSHRLLLAERIRTKFADVLATPEAAAAMAAGGKVTLETLLARWPKAGVQDEAGLTAVLSLITQLLSTSKKGD